jgi:rhamnulokinase
MLLSVVAPGTRLGPLRRSLCDPTGLERVDVLLPGTHDTASAVMGVPARATDGDRPQWCYISSGTWSLMGVETGAPIINERCRQLNFTNEGGVGGTTRVLKNIAGLWLVQECRRVWQQDGQPWSWDTLVGLAEQSAALRSLINPDAAEFVAPTDMPSSICGFCQRSGQPIPDTPGAVMRCALESLALRYRMVLQWLESLLGSRLATIHIVGGGSQNRLLCQMTADACARPVMAGPVEATAIGNLLLQAVAARDLGSIADAREVIRQSFPIVEYLPGDPSPWDDACERFRRYC